MPKPTRSAPTRSRAAARGLASALAGALLALPAAGPARAAPAGEQVIRGDGVTFDRSGNTTTIGTKSDLTIVEYQTFDILAGEVVRIDQPDASSRFLNRVPHGDPTRIDGSLGSNGFVYVLNPAGVFLGDSALVDVSGLVAGAGSLSDQDFLAGVDRFTDLTGDVEVAPGAQVVADQMVALVGRRVASFGAIRTEGGMIALVAGENAVLAKIDGRVVVRVDAGAAPDPGDDFALTQGGTLDAGSGRVSLTAGDAYSLALNHEGITRGREIELEAGGPGLVQVAGTLDASAGADERGGEISVTGDRVALLGATLDASGGAGGGRIRVGGDRSGQGELRTARRTFVDADSELRADARESGDGGQIVVWADEKTGFLGRASARGGERSGDGGFVEISGRYFLVSRGAIDVGAPQGDSGTLLYDPLEIRILGGMQDGTDPDSDGDVLVGSGGTQGQILQGEFSGQSDPVPFDIYESELENTDADILLEAQNRVFAEGSLADFSGGVVEIKPGNDLTIRTTATGVENQGIDLTLTPDPDDPDLAWMVSDGGTILLITSAGSVETPTDEVNAPIKAGTLIFGGRAYQVVPELGLSLSQPTTRTAVAISTLEGDIDVARIEANGDDASGTAPDELRLASPAGGVSVTAQSGDVRIGSIQANGGSDAGLVSAGGRGGTVIVSTVDGDVRIDGGIEALGGSGRSGFRAAEPIGAFGGGGGEIIVGASRIDDTGSKGNVSVLGDVLAVGGDAVGVFSDPESGAHAALGGTGGRVDVSAERLIEVRGSAGDPVVIDASAGSGSGAGGGPTNLVQGQSSTVVNAIELVTPAVPEGGNGGDIVLENATLVALGGNAGKEIEPSGPPGPGGAGGNGGNVLVQSSSGAVLAESATATARGGDGRFGQEGSAARPGFGGSGGTVKVSGGGDAQIGAIDVDGGVGDSGPGGAAGQVEVSSELGSVVVHDIDASGGAATEQVEALDGIRGGAGSTGIDLVTRSEMAGSVLLRGVITGFGGVGQDAQGDPDASSASAGFLIIDAAAGVVGEPASRIQVGSAEVSGATISEVRVAGTPRDDDRATLTAQGSLTAVLDDAGEPLESLEIVQRDIGASSSLVRGSNLADELLSASGDTVARTHSVTGMHTQAGDPSLVFALDEVLPVDSGGNPSSPGTLLIPVGAVDLGSAGGGIRNGAPGVGAGNDGAIEGEAPGVHVRSLGDFQLDGATLGAATPIGLTGADGAALRLVASGQIDVEVSGQNFGALDVTQGAAMAATHIALPDSALAAGPDEVTITGGGTTEAPVSRVDAVTDAGFVYRLVAAPAGVTGAELPDVEIQRLRIGGSGRIESPGDIHLDAPMAGDGETVALLTPGSDLAFVAGAGVEVADPGAGVSIDMGGDGGADPADLRVELGGSLGAEGAELSTRGLERVAGRFLGGFHLRNEGSDLRIATVGPIDPSDLSGSDADAPGQQLSGLISRDLAVVGDVVIANPGGRIVLGQVDPLSGTTVHVASTGDLRLEGPVEIDNARFVSTAVPDGLGGTTVELQAHNDASLIARGGIEIDSIDTAMDAKAIDDRSDLAPGEKLDDTPAAGELTLSAQGGRVVLHGDVGMRDDEGILASLDTTAMTLEGDPRTLRAGQLVFRGALDGASHAVLRGVLPDGTDARTSRVSFGGDVGATTPLTGLDVQADQIRFSLAPEDGNGSANRVVVAGDVLLDTGQTGTPLAATVVDTQGGLSIDAQRLTLAPGEKLSVTGNLAIRADDTVTVGDISAARLRIDSPHIEVRRRDAAPVELADGSSAMDDGVDWVANQISTSSVPTPIGAGAAPTLVLGSGGISVPGSLGDFRVRRFTTDLDAVTAASFAGQDGTVLDLRGTGGAFAGDPSQQLPREEPLDLPPPVLRTDGAPAAPAPPVSGREALAYLHCGDPRAQASDCPEADASALASFAALDVSALGTPRAREIHERYRALIAGPGAAEQLRALFERAGRAFGRTREWNDGSLEGAELTRFLRDSREPGRPALEALRELAWLLAEIELLGLDDATTERLQASLADDFARAAAVPGLTSAQARAAAGATSVGLPEPPPLQ